MVLHSWISHKRYQVVSKPYTSVNTIAIELIDWFTQILTVTI